MKCTVRYLSGNPRGRDNLFILPKGTQAKNFVSNAYSKNSSEQVERPKKYDDDRDNI